MRTFTRAPHMRLSEFIRVHADDILACWDEFAATVPHEGKELDHKALRDHAGQILLTIAVDLEAPQTGADQIAKSRGELDHGKAVTAAEIHADTRIVAGFAIDSMLTEYRALRASVLRLWAASKGDETHTDEADQLTRFNEAIDQVICESVGRYTEQVRRYTNIFMGMLGHDIRNPLNTITLCTEVLVRTGQLSRTAAQPIVGSAGRIQSIIGLIMDFSRAQAEGAMPISPHAANLQEVFQGVVAEAQFSHPGTECQLVVHGNAQGVWDAQRLTQLLSNLLENALAYGTPGRPITIALNDMDAEQSISVHNFGQTIPVHDLERIFEPRSRGSVLDQSQAPQGMGLGLYISREIMRAHNGTLSVRSSDQEGTTFTARLPRQQPEMQTTLL
jgi:signal transduction histidine kinase